MNVGQPSKLAPSPPELVGGGVCVREGWQVKPTLSKRHDVRGGEGSQSVERCNLSSLFQLGGNTDTMKSPSSY